MQKQLQKGFTLIELMIVIAIVGLLATLAVPRYMDYTKRAKLAEVLAALDAAKLPVAEYHMTNGKLPDSLTLPKQSSKYVANVEYKVNSTTGYVTATLQGDDAFTSTSNKLSLRGAIEGNNLVWTCVSGDSTGATPVDAAYLPSSCTPPEKPANS